MSEIIIEEIKPKKSQSETLKRAKAKYYSKKKLDPDKTKEYTIQNVIKIM